ncbi:MAG: tRNA lysidine(34) synthetase TilS [Enterobacterales bacterium]
MSNKVNILKKSIYKQITNVIVKYKSLLLAFSGGLDSTVLLYILCKIKNKFFIKDKNKVNNANEISLRVIHINHNFNKNSNKWVKHCKLICNSINVKFKCLSIFLDKKYLKKYGIESSLRYHRYNALKKELNNKEVLLTAHNLDDQTESFLLALKRGSGPKGLSAMLIDSPFGKTRLLRPLLKFSKIDLLKYANEKNLFWIDDDSNNNIKFDRNFLRLNILPCIKKRWPQFSKVVFRSAQLCYEQEVLLNDLLRNQLSYLILKNCTLNILPLIKMSNIYIYSILRRWLSFNNIKMPSKKQIVILWEEVALSKIDSVAQLKIHNCIIKRFNNCLYILHTLSKITISWFNSYNINYKHQYTCSYIIQTKNLIKNNKYKNYLLNQYLYHSTGTLNKYVIVRAPYNTENIHIKFGNINGLIHIVGRIHGRSIKKIYQELNIPPWERKNIPLLFYNNNLIAAIGVFTTLFGKKKDCDLSWIINSTKS